MTVQETLNAIEVMTAFTQGKRIQVFENGMWKDIDGSSGHTPAWDWSKYEYREYSGPEKIWLVRYPNGCFVHEVFFTQKTADEVVEKNSHLGLKVIEISLPEEPVSSRELSIGDRVKIVLSEPRPDYSKIYWDPRMDKCAGQDGTVIHGFVEYPHFVEVRVDGCNWWFHKNDLQLVSA